MPIDSTLGELKMPKVGANTQRVNQIAGQALIIREGYIKERRTKWAL